MRYTRKVFAICIGTALVMVAALLVAVSAPKPAVAAPTVFTPIWNGGDLTMSETIPISASDFTTEATQIIAPSIGLATTSSLDQIGRAIATDFENRGQWPSSTTGLAPLSVPTEVIQAVTMTVIDSAICSPCATVTETAPAATIAMWRQYLQGIVVFLAHMPACGPGLFYPRFSWPGVCPPPRPQVRHFFSSSRTPPRRLGRIRGRPGSSPIWSKSRFSISGLVFR